MLIVACRIFSSAFAVVNNTSPPVLQDRCLSTNWSFVPDRLFSAHYFEMPYVTKSLLDVVEFSSFLT